MRAILAILAGLVLAGVPQTLLAQCGTVCAAPKKAIVVKQVVKVETVLAAQFVPVVVPAFSVGYAPGAVPAYGIPAVPQPTAAAADQQLLQRVQQLEAALAQRSSADAPAVLPQRATARPTGAPAILAGKCAACHGPSPKGNDLSLFAGDGTLRHLSADQMARVLERAGDNTMPPAAKHRQYPPLTGREYAAVERELRSQAAP